MPKKKNLIISGELHTRIKQICKFKKNLGEQINIQKYIEETLWNKVKKEENPDLRRDS